MSRRFLALVCLCLPAGAWADEPVERQGPLAGLPSKAGKHIEKIQTLRDNQQCGHGFYSLEVNAHFLYTAGDSDDHGSMWAYRYKNSK